MVCTSEPALLREACSSVEYKFGDLPPLHPGAVDGDFATLNFRHAFQSKVAELIAVQDHAGRVEGVLLSLHWVLKPHGEGVAGAL